MWVTSSIIWLQGRGEPYLGVSLSPYSSKIWQVQVDCGFNLQQMSGGKISEQHAEQILPKKSELESGNCAQETWRRWTLAEGGSLLLKLHIPRLEVEKKTKTKSRRWGAEESLSSPRCAPSQHTEEPRRWVVLGAAPLTSQATWASGSDDAKPRQRGSNCGKCCPLVDI